MNKAVNFNGYKTPASRARRSRRANSAENLIATFRAMGMSDDEIKAELEKVQAERAALKAQVEAAFGRKSAPPKRGREAA